MTLRTSLARVATGTLPRFLLVGALGFAIDLTAFLGARALMPDVAARLLALAVAVTATWWLNRRHTFGSADPDRLGEWLRYAAISAVGAGVNAGVSLAILWQLPRIPAAVALAIGSVAALSANFAGSRALVFRVPPSVPPSSSPYSPGKV